VTKNKMKMCVKIFFIGSSRKLFFCKKFTCFDEIVAILIQNLMKGILKQRYLAQKKMPNELWHLS